MSGLSAPFRTRARIFYRGDVRELYAGGADNVRVNGNRGGFVVQVCPGAARILGVYPGGGAVPAVCSCGVPVFSDHLDSSRPIHRPVMKYGSVPILLILSFL